MTRHLIVIDQHDECYYWRLNYLHFQNLVCPLIDNFSIPLCYLQTYPFSLEITKYILTVCIFSVATLNKQVLNIVCKISVKYKVHVIRSHFTPKKATVMSIPRVILSKIILQKNGNNSLYIVDSKVFDRLNLVQLKPDNNASLVF